MNTIDHVLDELLLRSTESPSVGDIKHTIVGLSVLTVGTTNLDVVLISDLLELSLVLGELGQLDVDGSSEGSTKVSRAGSNVTEMFILGELAVLLDLGGGSGESAEDSLDISSVLRRDNSELILLIDPDQESLGVIVEDTTTAGPVSVEVASLEESVTLLEKEVISDELLGSSFIHSFERIESTLEIVIKVLGSFNNVIHNLESLFLGDTGAKRVFGEVSSDTDTGGVNHLLFIVSKSGVLKTLGVHVSNMLIFGFMTVII